MARGRMGVLRSYSSRAWAIQPAVRAMAKMASAAPRGMGGTWGRGARAGAVLGWGGAAAGRAGGGGEVGVGWGGGGAGGGGGGGVAHRRAGRPRGRGAEPGQEVPGAR